MFCSINSTSSVFTLKIPKRMHFNNWKKQNKVWNVGRFMHSTAEALIT